MNLRIIVMIILISIVFSSIYKEHQSLVPDHKSDLTSGKVYHQMIYYRGRYETILRKKSSPGWNFGCLNNKFRNQISTLLGLMQVETDPLDLNIFVSSIPLENSRLIPHKIKIYTIK